MTSYNTSSCDEFVPLFYTCPTSVLYTIVNGVTVFVCVHFNVS